MPVSSGTRVLFSTLFVFGAIAATAAYGLQHRSQLHRLMTEITAKAAGRLAERQAASVDSDSDTTAPHDSAEVELRASPSGHFETEVEINGRSLDVMIDTGATFVSLTYEDAERAGIYLKSSDFTHQTSTANGTARIAPIEIHKISVGGITVHNVRGCVSERGKLEKTLLGMSFLSRLSRVEMRSKSLVLHE